MGGTHIPEARRDRGKNNISSGNSRAGRAGCSVACSSGPRAVSGARQGGGDPQQPRGRDGQDEGDGTPRNGPGCCLTAAGTSRMGEIPAKVTHRDRDPPQDPPPQARYLPESPPPVPVTHLRSPSGPGIPLTAPPGPVTDLRCPSEPGILLTAPPGPGYPLRSPTGRRFPPPQSPADPVPGPAFPPGIPTPSPTPPHPTPRPQFPLSEVAHPRISDVHGCGRPAGSTAFPLPSGAASGGRTHPDQSELSPPTRLSSPRSSRLATY